MNKKVAGSSVKAARDQQKGGGIVVDITSSAPPVNIFEKFEEYAAEREKAVDLPDDGPDLAYGRDEAFGAWFAVELKKLDRGTFSELVRLSDNVVAMRPSCGLAAQRYAECGWYVFAANLEDGEKKSYKSAEHSGGVAWGMTKDADQIKHDFSKWRQAGVGIPTGAVNGIIDIETDTVVGHRVDGGSSLQQLEIELGPLPETTMFMSPTGSLHRLYNYPSHLGDIWIKSTAGGLAPGVDMKADGGMLISPPSWRGDGFYVPLNKLPQGDLTATWIKRIIELNGDARKPTGVAAAANIYEAHSLQQRRAPTERIAAAVAVIPNDDVGWDDWNTVGMAIYAATGGEGFEIFAAWSAKSAKHDARNTINKWQALRGCPPTEIGAGSIFRWAEEANPGWRDADKAKPGVTTKTKTRLMQSSAEFVAGFVPPDYLVDGLLQRRFVYSLTGPTGSGKTCIAMLLAIHVALGLAIGNMEVEKGRVLFFAGENPDDVRTRWIMICEKMGLDPDELDVFFMPGAHLIGTKDIRKQIDAEAAEHGPFSLLIVDTSAAYYSGVDENDNVQLGNHARMLRTFIELPGGPTILVTCHPTKNPNMENLLPRGGGAFLAEVDGNLVSRNPAAWSFRSPPTANFAGLNFSRSRSSWCRERASG
jgi:AAA domain/Bifunctional DNA primase/polymerase, N-terminal/Primase C terminal 2 (PriCT-2)